MLTALGLDVGADLGVRLSGPMRLSGPTRLSGPRGFALCVVADLVFRRYRKASITGGENG